MQTLVAPKQSTQTVQDSRVSLQKERICVVTIHASGPAKLDSTNQPVEYSHTERRCVLGLGIFFAALGLGRFGEILLVQKTVSGLLLSGCRQHLDHS